MFCSECGKAIEEGVVFCPNCGEKIGETLQRVSPATKPTEKGFFKSLFDFSFKYFITTKIIKFIYLLFLLFAGLGALALIIAGFKYSTGAGIGTLILSPLIFLLIVIYIRMVLELIIVIFRIAEYVREISQQKRS